MHTIVPSGPAVSEIEEELAARINQIETETDIENVIVWHREQIVELKSEEILSEPVKRQRRILGGLKRKAKRERRLLETTGNQFYRTLAEAREGVIRRVEEKKAEAKGNPPEPPTSA